MAVDQRRLHIRMALAVSSDSQNDINIPAKARLIKKQYAYLGSALPRAALQGFAVQAGRRPPCAWRVPYGTTFSARML